MPKNENIKKVTGSRDDKKERVVVKGKQFAKGRGSC
jgi:hypothetical protein